MNWLHALVLGIVEGVTEFLPVSSTGHLILAADLLGLTETEFLKSFEIAIQLGAILAVVATSWRRFLDRAVLARVAVAFLPTAVIGLALYGFIKKHLLGNELVVVWALVLGGLALIAFERFRPPMKHVKTDLSSMSFTHAVLIGLSQSLAIIPGTSRSASTILGGMALGWSRAAIVEFSFLLAVPTMAAATGLDLLKSGFDYSLGEYELLAIGFVAAYVVATGVVRWFLSYVRKNDFAAFGFYRIFAAFAFWWFILR